MNKYDMSNFENRIEPEESNNSEFYKKVFALIRSAIDASGRTMRIIFEYIFWDNLCPYCNADIKRISKKTSQISCSKCNQQIFVRRENQATKFITEDQRRDIEMYQSIDSNVISFDEFIQLKLELIKNSHEKVNKTQILIHVYEHMIKKSVGEENLEELQKLLEKKVSLLKKVHQPFAETMKQLFLTQIKNIKSKFGDKKVLRIVTQDANCDYCLDIKRKKFISLDDAENVVSTLYDRCPDEFLSMNIIFDDSDKYIHKFYITEKLIFKLLSEYAQNYPTLRINDYKFFKVDRWLINNGDIVDEDSLICSIRLFKEKNDNYSGIEITFDSPANGALEIVLNTNIFDKECISEAPLLCKIHKNPTQQDIENIWKERFHNIPDIENDKFTGEKILKWRTVCGITSEDSIEFDSDNDQGEIWLTFNNIANENYLVIRYLFKNFKLTPGCKISILFDESETIDFLLKDKPKEHSKIYHDNRQVLLYEARVRISLDDLEIFKSRSLTGWRIEIVKTGKIITGSLSNPAWHFAIKNFVSDYVRLVEQETSTTDKPKVLQGRKIRAKNNYKLPNSEILNHYEINHGETELKRLDNNKDQIINVLQDFDIKIEKISAVVGPTVTLFEIIPARGMRISKIKSLEEDISLSLSALGIRIIAPMPGKGTIGIEVPNQKPEIVSLRSVIDKDVFHQSSFDLPIALGKTMDDKPFIIDLTTMPHLLMAGATGQGKSVGLNVIISSLLFKRYPGELQFVLIDPKKVEFSMYDDIKDKYLYIHPKMKNTILTETDEIIEMLELLCMEMENRFKVLVNAKSKNIKEFNDKLKDQENQGKIDSHGQMPYLVVIIDEFADLMLTGKAEVEKPITRLAQLARAVGIHLVIATQRPSVDIISGVIKANFPTRLSYRVASKVDSRTILDDSGAEKLIGKGDMLFSDGGNITRLQTPFVTTDEVERLILHIKGY